MVNQHLKLKENVFMQFPGKIDKGFSFPGSLFQIENTQLGKIKRNLCRHEKKDKERQSIFVDQFIVLRINTVYKRTKLTSC